MQYPEASDSLNVIIMASAPAADAGAAGGVMQTMQQVGGSLGLAILVTVAATATRQAAGHGVSGPALLVAGMTAGFAASALFGVLLFLLALTFRRTFLATERKDARTGP
ncbi:hypothetical protein GCM10009765_67830 [Fodinicola feengrottensis]|uniref:Major facilitator superfamily (MFS) profile domain-containing protein n=1 Tax=Fodinicola feengrottensis TaxID=435914 RepID=A0ABN2INQ1_9ACTN